MDSRKLDQLVGSPREEIKQSVENREAKYISADNFNEKDLDDDTIKHNEGQSSWQKSLAANKNR